MKRSRAKAVGLGLALIAGQLRADEPTAPAPAATPPAVRPAPRADWNAADAGDIGTVWLPARGRPAAKPATPPVPPAVPVPAGGPVGASPAPLVPLTPSGPPVTPAGVADAVLAAPGAVKAADVPAPQPAGPRADPASPFGPLPSIPPLPQPEGVAQTDPPPAVMPARPTVTGPAPAPAPAVPPPESVSPVPMPLTAPTPVPPAPVTPAPVAPPVTTLNPEWAPVPPAVPGPRPMPVLEGGVGSSFGTPTTPQPDPVPPPRPVTPPKADSPLPPPRPVTPPPATNPPATNPPTAPPAAAEGELPVAPPHLMYPGPQVPGKHGTFGSPPVRISKDYPSLRDLCHDEYAGPGANPKGAAADRLYFQAEYLMWWVNRTHVPILATTSTLPAPAGTAGLGFLGDPSTLALIGPGAFGNQFRQGLRIRGGLWFDDCGTCGIDGSFFFLGRTSTSVGVASPNPAVITRPFFAPNMGGVEFGEIVALPGFAAGAFDATATSYLWGADVNLRNAICKRCDFRAEWFAGYRFLSLDERLTMTESITALTGNGIDPAGTRVVVQDQFHTRNRFHGGQLGLAAEKNWGPVSVGFRGSVALGGTQQQLDIAGGQTRLRPGMDTPMTFTGGLLATGPNLGSFSQTRFSVVPEASLNVGYWVTPNVKFYAGYNVLYWSNVIRPGEQIDRVVDLTAIPNSPMGVAPSGLARPHPLFKQTDLWVNGIQLGVELRW